MTSFMTRALTLVIVAVSAVLVVAVEPQQRVGAAGTERVTQDQIIALERTRQEAFVRGDVDFLDRQTAEDYTTVNFAGTMSTKPEMMRGLRAGTTKVSSFELDDLRARIYGNVAVLTGIYRDESSVNGKGRRVNARFTRIFVNDGGVWRAVSYQQTALN